MASQPSSKVSAREPHPPPRRATRAAPHRHRCCWAISSIRRASSAEALLDVEPLVEREQRLEKRIGIGERSGLVDARQLVLRRLRGRDSADAGAHAPVGRDRVHRAARCWSGRNSSQCPSLAPAQSSRACRRRRAPRRPQVGASAAMHVNDVEGHGQLERARGNSVASVAEQHESELAARGTQEPVASTVAAIGASTAGAPGSTASRRRSLGGLIEQVASRATRTAPTAGRC